MKSISNLRTEDIMPKLDKAVEIQAKLKYIASFGEANRLYMGKTIDKYLLKCLCLLSGYRLDLSKDSKDNSLNVTDTMKYKSLLRNCSKWYHLSEYKVSHKTLKGFIKFAKLIVTKEVQSLLQDIEAGKYPRNKRPICTYANVIGNSVYCV